MTGTTTAQTNLDIYGSDDFTWGVARELLEAGPGEHFWLATTGRDGSPYLAGIGARWIDDQLWFVSGGDTHKSRNLERRPDCAIAAELPDLDVTFRGRARRVADQADGGSVGRALGVDRLAGSARKRGNRGRLQRAVRRAAALASLGARGPFCRSRRRAWRHALAFRLNLRAAPEGLDPSGALEGMRWSKVWRVAIGEESIVFAAH